MFGSFAAGRPVAGRAPRPGRRRVRPARAPLADRRGRADRAAGCSTRSGPTGRCCVENETDGYHPQFVHCSIFGVAESGIGDLYGERSTAVSRDLGNGHTENDLRPEFRRIGQPLGWFGTDPRGCPTTSPDARRPTATRPSRSSIDGSPHVMIFPNLFIAEIQLFVIQPLAVDETVQHVTALQFPGCAGHEPADAAADHRLGRPGRLPARRRLRDVRAQPARRAGAGAGVAGASSAGCTASGSTTTGSPIADVTDELAAAGDLAALPVADGGGAVNADRRRRAAGSRAVPLPRGAAGRRARATTSGRRCGPTTRVYWVPANGDDTDPTDADVDHLRQPLPDRHPDQASCRPASATPSRRRRGCAAWSSNVEVLGDDGTATTCVACATSCSTSPRTRGMTPWAGRVRATACGATDDGAAHGPQDGLASSTTTAPPHAGLPDLVVLRGRNLRRCDRFQAAAPSRAFVA